MNTNKHYHSRPRQLQAAYGERAIAGVRKDSSQVQVIESSQPARPIHWGAMLSIVLMIGLILLPLILLSLAGGFYAYYQTSGRIIPGVMVGSSHVGGLPITAAALELEKTWNLDNQITITNGIQTVRVSPAELGLRLDALNTVRAAYQIGHKDSTVDRIGHLMISITQGWPVAPLVIFDENQARAGLEHLSPQLSLPARNASIRVEGEKLSAIPGEIGYTILIDETLADLKRDPAGIMQSSFYQIKVVPVSPQVSDLTPILAQAEDFLNHPAGFHAYDAIKNEYLDFPIPKETLVSWLSLEMQDQAPVLSLDQAKIASSVQQWSANLGEGRYFDAEKVSGQIAEAVKFKQAPVVLISHAPSTYTVQPGDTLLKIGWKLGMPFWMIIRANPDLDADHLVAGSSLTIPSKDELLPLPVVTNKRILISIKKQRLRVYQDGNLLSEHIISTGIDRSPTQPGIFQVQTHEKNAYASVWDLRMPHFLGIYEAWPGFMNGIHGLPTLSNGQRLWANILGKPASYGCIILNLDDAKWLYEWAETGVVVEITP